MATYYSKISQGRSFLMLILEAIVLISCIVEVKCQQSSTTTSPPSLVPCEEWPSFTCPEIICKLMKSRQTDFCKDIHCEGVTPQDCTDSNSEYSSELTMCGCCPGCQKRLEEGDPCEVGSSDPVPNVNCTDPFCPILIQECGSGLVCDYLGESSKVCAPDKSRPPGSGPDKSLTCEDKRSLGLAKHLHWTPNCEEDGSYSPKQCKGTEDDGVCFCSDKDGNRIFGREWWYNSANQTCACSRQVDELRKQGNIAAIHCSADGNYEALQCDMDSGICYCVNPETGKLTGAVVPEHLWKELPCYSLNVTGGDPTGTYLRVCESEWVAAQRIRQEATLHGLSVLAGRDLVCDFDGSYGPIVNVDGTSYCADKMGSLSGHKMFIDQVVDGEKMNCQCYRDSLVYQEQSRHFQKKCQDLSGNYAKISESDFTPGKKMFRCVDRDGVFFGDEVPEANICCLLDNCSNPSDKEKCYDKDTGIGFRSCSSFPQ